MKEIPFTIIRVDSWDEIRSALDAMIEDIEKRVIPAQQGGKPSEHRDDREQCKSELHSLPNAISQTRRGAAPELSVVIWFGRPFLFLFRKLTQSSTIPNPSFSGGTDANKVAAAFQSNVKDEPRVCLAPKAAPQPTCQAHSLALATG